MHQPLLAGLGLPFFPKFSPPHQNILELLSNHHRKHKAADAIASRYRTTRSEQGGGSQAAPRNFERRWRAVVLRLDQRIFGSFVQRPSQCPNSGMRPNSRMSGALLYGAKAIAVWCVRRGQNGKRGSEAGSLLLEQHTRPRQSQIDSALTSAVQRQRLRLRAIGRSIRKENITKSFQLQSCQSAANPSRFSV